MDDLAAVARSHPYLDAVDQRRRRNRALVVCLVIGVVLALAVVAVVDLTPTVSEPRSALVDPGSAPASTQAWTARTTAPSHAPMPTSGSALAVELPPVPTAVITVAPTAVTCNDADAETSTILSWTSTDAATAVVVGPDGQISTQAAGNREILPARPCAEAPFADTYTFSAGSEAGTVSVDATVTWTANTVAGPDDDPLPDGVPTNP